MSIKFTCHHLHKELISYIFYCPKQSVHYDVISSHVFLMVSAKMQWSFFKSFCSFVSTISGCYWCQRPQLQTLLLLATSFPPRLPLVTLPRRWRHWRTWWRCRRRRRCHSCQRQIVAGPCSDLKQRRTKIRWLMVGFS